MPTNNDPLHVEKHLLSLFSCGCYINAQEIVEMGKILDVELPYKKRAFILQTLLIHAKQTQQSLKLLTLLCDLLDDKMQQMTKLIEKYPKTKFVMQNFLFKTNSTKLLLQRELALHVKENNES
ncbi:MAG: hypothetical protein J0647_11820 [Campylobacteraceae bacterium]|nr:hypothetical protein [Campylobacteraceae bacterium]